MTYHLLTVAYNGLHYSGYQIQKNAMTVQEKLMDAASQFIHTEFSLTVAGRTDSGVHAKGQKVMLITSKTMPLDKWRLAFNAHLPEDIVVWQVEAVNPHFHPRYCKHYKTYTYRILYGGINLPIAFPNYFFYRKSLDVDKMVAVAPFLEGTHDYNAFSSSKKTVDQTIRRVRSIEIDTQPGHMPGQEMLVIKVTGDGFLYNMVRILAGALFDAGRDQAPLAQWKDRIERAYQTRQREVTWMTLPAEGLTLEDIIYEEEKPGEKNCDEFTVCFGPK